MASWTRSSLAVLLSLGLSGAPALAAKPRPAEAQAKAAFQEGKRAYDLGQFEEALARYTEAYRLKPVPALLFNIAQCHRQLGHAERAGFYYRRFVDEAPDNPNAPTARELAAEMDARLAQEEQGKRQEQEAARIKELEAARSHSAQDQAAAEKARAEAARAEAEAAARKRELDEKARAAALAQAPAPVVEKPLTSRWYFWAGVAGGAALLAGGIGTAVWASQPRPQPGSLGTVDAR